MRAHRPAAVTVALVALVALVAAVVCAPTAGAAGRGPDLTVPVDELAAATWCDATAANGSAQQTVLLIHGTGSTPEEAWGWNYMIALSDAGFGICTVTLPERAVADFTVSAEYAVYAARHAYALSHRPIAIIGHSQGGLMAVWIAKFWPDVAANATDVIGLAANVRGTELANTLCVAGACSPIAWQMRRGSRVTNAATSAPLPDRTSFTSIATRTDEIVFPQPEVSRLDGARNVLVQDVCPLRVTDHGLLLSDPVGYALVLDALTHDGPADPARVSRSACWQAAMPGTDLLGSTQLASTVVGLAVGLLNVGEWTSGEAPIPAYAEPYTE